MKPTPRNSGISSGHFFFFFFLVGLGFELRALSLQRVRSTT
jgi:hypothetical protein